MPCKYLHTYQADGRWTVTTCEARHRLYVPSVSDLHNFCQGGNYRTCPLYRAPFAKEGTATVVPCPDYPFQTNG